MTKTKEFKFRLTEKEFEEMRELAEKEGRTMSNLLRYLVAKERKGMEIQKDIEKSFEENEKDFEDFIKRYGRVRTHQNDEVRE